MISAVDTNILLDVLIPYAPHHESSLTLLREALAGGILIINEVVYAELASQFQLASDLDLFLEDTGITLVSTGREALACAGGIWRLYARKRQFQCTTCGKALHTNCPDCGNSANPRQHILSDFIIGAFALRQSAQLFSRDRGFYRHYFKELVVRP
jgi:predicted nucleic acid-binding protein